MRAEPPAHEPRTERTSPPETPVYSPDGPLTTAPRTPDEAAPTPGPSTSTSPRALVGAGALTVLAFVLRVAVSVRAGPIEGGGDEWYSAWRALSALLQRGNPGDFMHPALGYLAFALALALRALGLRAPSPSPGADSAPVTGLPARAFADFALHERAVLQTLQATSALFSALTVPAVYLLARRAGATARASLFAAALLTFARLHLEYGQRVRVDALFALCTTLALAHVLALARAPRTRTALFAGALVGLSISANYPGALLVAPLVWAGTRRRSRDEALAPVCARALVAVGAVLVAYVAANPYLVLRFDDARRGFAYQLAYATRVHPGQAPPSVAYYLSELASQGSLFVPACTLAFAWALTRRGSARPLALCAAGYFAVFTLLRTQFDRYVLPAVPWLCALLGLAFDALEPYARALAARYPARAPVIRGLPYALALVLVYSLAGPGLRSARQGPPPGPPDARGDLQRWLLSHAGPGEVLWVQADRAPLLQALYADVDPDATQASLDPIVRTGREVVRAVYPRFGARVLKGEFVARIALVRPDELARERVTLVLACPESHRARDPHRPPPAYDDLLREAARVGTVLYTPGNECVVLRVRAPDHFDQ